MSAPGPVDIMAAVGAVLSTCASAGNVVIDPIIEEKNALEGYVRQVTKHGTATQGWLVTIVAEEPDEPKGTNGGKQTVVVGLTAVKRVEIGSSGSGDPVPSRTVFNTMIVEAKAAFRLAANRALGFTSDPAVVVTHRGIYAPGGYFSIQAVKEWKYHLGPMECRVSVGVC